jgi:hypothetical protein
MRMGTLNGTRRTGAENAEFVIRSVKELGFQPHPESRLMRMHRVLTVPNRMITPDDPDLETALEAERDMQVLGLIFDQLAAQCSDSEFPRLVKTALKDSLLPQNDRAQSKGRDAQFELFVAAVCQSAGMLPVAREEPDVTCTVEGIKFGIAAKRVKNLANLEEHVRKAADQIHKAGLPGIIALDTSTALNRENERIWAPIPDKEYGRLYKEAMRQFTAEYHDRIQDWVRRKRVRGLVIHDQQVRLPPSGHWGLEGMTEFVCTARENQRRRREFATFEKQYVKGLPNLRHL